MEFPLISACANGELRLIKTYIGIQADVEVTNNNGQTGLMVACQNGFYKIVDYLIQSGADINRKDSKGMTAIHHCVESGSLDCLNILVDSGAELDEKYEDMTILRMAAADGQSEMVEHLMETFSYSPAEPIEALEILGAVCVYKQNHANARKYWLMALEERLKADNHVQPKLPIVHSVFGIANEFQTVTELNRIASSEEDMSIQAILVMERLLGAQHHLTTSFMERRATAYYLNGNIDRCFSLRYYVLQLKLASHGPLNEGPTKSSLNSLVDLLVNAMRDGLPVKYRHLMMVLTQTVHMAKLALQHCVVDSPRYYRVLPLYSPFVFRLVDVIARFQPATVQGDQQRLRGTLTEFVQLNLRDAQGLTPLHFAFSRRALFQWSRFDVAKPLLDAGADSEAVDDDNNTPLHHLAACRIPYKNVALVKMLLSRGAHYDACNADGRCFTDYLPRDIVRDIGNPFQFCQLQCLSATALRKYDVPYTSVLPPKLVRFVNSHCSRPMFVSSGSNVI